jgi:hypothetical protein
MASQGFQDYRQRQQPQAAPLGPDVGAQMLGEPEAPMMPGPLGTDEHSPESTETALRTAIGMALAPKRNMPGGFSMRQLRQMGVPESEITIGRASGLVEGDD